MSSTSFSSRSLIMRSSQQPIESLALKARRYEESSWPRRSRQLPAGQSPKRLEILLARFHHDIVGQRRHRWLFVPFDAFEIIAHELLIEAWWRSAWGVAVGGPESRRVGREHFINQNQSIARQPSIFRQQAKLEFGIGDDDADRFGVCGAFGVQLQCQLTGAVEDFRIDDRSGIVGGDIDVVAALRLGRGSK